MSAFVDRVYIIGAGASVPYGLPTLKTLTWDLCQSLSNGDRRVFEDAVYESFGVKMRSGQDSPDFEELLNRLDPRALVYLQDTGLGGPDASRRKAAELALSGLRTFIREKCLQVADTPGPYDRLVQSLNERTAAVSFNWDVLLERAFLRAGRPFTYLPTKRAEGSTVLLKPHGSINWFALLDRELLMITRDSNLDCIGDDLSYYLLYLTDPLALVDFGSSSPFVKLALAPVPAIVAPTASKLLSVGGEPRDGFVAAGHDRAMRAIWSTFKTMLDQASELVVVGYSLPGTDAASTELLKHFASGGTPTKAKRVLLVEPNTAVEERYSRMLRVNARIVCRSFGDFDPEVLVAEAAGGGEPPAASVSGVPTVSQDPAPICMQATPPTEGQGAQGPGE